MKSIFSVALTTNQTQQTVLGHVDLPCVLGHVDLPSVLDM